MIIACTETDNVPVAPLRPTTAVPAASSAARDELIAASQGRTDRGFEDWILRLEAQAPGVGGLFSDSSGSPVLLVQPGADRGRVLSALQQWGNDVQLGGSFRTRLAAGAIEFREARFGFSQLVAWQRAALPSLLREVPELISTDADEAANRLRIRVSAGAATGAVARVLTATAVPVDAA